MKTASMRRSRRKARSSAPDLFDWARENELLASPATRAISRRTGYSPALASIIAELAGLIREGR